jgi:tol-pal system protein YbgF
MVGASNVPCSLGAALLLLAMLLLPVSVRAQDATTQARLDRLERDLNMLQRQVYRGAPTAPQAAPGGAAPNAADVEIRMERLEDQMRELTGRVEQFNNNVEQLRQRIEQINSDYDVRFNQLSGGTVPPAPPPPRGSVPEPRIAGGGSPAPAALMPPGTVVQAPDSRGPGPIFNTLTPPGQGPSRQLPPPVPPQNEDAEPSDAPSASGGSPTQQFNHAFGLVKQADYPGAETALKAFIEAHPNDPLAANAQYWLGETYYARNKYMEAAAAFAEGYKRWPKGAKAADDLLKLGMSLARADQKKNACIAFAQLDGLPGANAAIRERANAEKKHVGCS